jgi:PAS domain S-box-containing protein
MLDQNHLLVDVARHIPGTIYQFVLKKDGSFAFPYIGERSQDFFGLHPDEVMTNPEKIFETLPTEDNLRVQEAIQKSARTLTEYRIEHRVRKPSGEVIWLDVRSTPQKLENGDILWNGVALDITERKQAEENLLKIQQELQSTLNATTDGIWTWDFETNQLTFSPRYYTMLGYEPDEFDPSYGSWRDLIHPDDLPDALAAAEKYLQTKPDTYENEFRLRTKGGEYRWVHARGRVVERDESGAAVRMVGNHEDITDRKNTELALVESESKYRTLVESSPDGIVTISKTGKLLSVNKAFLDLTGFEESDFVGKNFLQAPTLIPQDLKFYSKIVKDLLRGKGLDITEFRWQHASGEIRNGEAKTTLLRQDGKTVGLLGIVRDITERVQAVEALQESELLNRSLLQNAGAGIGYYDLEGRAILFNELAILYMGGKPEDYIGKSVVELFGPELGAQYLERIHQAAQSPEPISFEDLVTLPTGTKWFSSHYTRNDDPDGNAMGVMIVSHDVTDRKQAEEALRESQNRFERAMEATRDGLFDWDLTTNEIYYSPGWKSMLGYAYDELPNDFSVWETLTDPEDVKRSWEMQTELVNMERDRFEIEFKMKHKDGHWVDILSRAFAIFDENGVAVRVVGTHVDISERIQVERALRESESKYRTLVDGTRQGVIIAQSNPVRLVFANPAMQQITGYPPERLLGMGPDELERLIFEEDRLRFFSNFHKRIQGESIPKETEYRLLCKDGAIKWVAIYSSRIEYMNETATLTTFMDITERKQAEEERQRLHEQVIRDANELERRVQERTEQYQTIIDLATDREIRMIELKKVIKKLRKRLEEVGLEPGSDDSLGIGG